RPLAPRSPRRSPTLAPAACRREPATAGTPGGPCGSCAASAMLPDERDHMRNERGRVGTLIILARPLERVPRALERHVGRAIAELLEDPRQHIRVRERVLRSLKE